MINILENVSLKDFSWWKVGGPAEYYCAPATTGELAEALLWASRYSREYCVLGQGSNVLISDQGVSGLVIHTLNLNEVISEISDAKVVVKALSGTPKSEVLKVFMKHRLPPAVFLAGLPGDVGGGVVMNAGIGLNRKPREFCEIVESFEVINIDENENIQTRSFAHQEVNWQYRHCYGWQPGVISWVTMSWPNEPDDNVLIEVREGNKRRKATQPLNWPSCGSTFKNPPANHAGVLIEQAGLKGFTIGGAQVSEKHANFIINLGDATAKDIDSVIKHVQATVADRFNVQLTTEVVYLGRW